MLHAAASCSPFNLQVNGEVMERKFSILTENLGHLDSDGVRVSRLKLSLAEDYIVPSLITVQ